MWYSQVNFQCFFENVSTLIACRGCEMWVVREGYEGLVRGNQEHAAKIGSEINAQTIQDIQEDVKVKNTFLGKSPPERNILNNLRLAQGDLLLVGAREHGGRGT